MLPSLLAFVHAWYRNTFGIFIPRWLVGLPSSGRVLPGLLWAAPFLPSGSSSLAFVVPVKESWYAHVWRLGFSSPIHPLGAACGHVVGFSIRALGSSSGLDPTGCCLSRGWIGIPASRVGWVVHLAAGVAPPLGFLCCCQPSPGCPFPWEAVHSVSVRLRPVTSGTLVSGL